MISGFFVGLVFGAMLVLAFEAAHYYLTIRRNNVDVGDFLWHRNKTTFAKPGSIEYFHRVLGHKE